MTELAKRYGGSLYDLAAEEQLTDQLLAELDVALDCFNQEPAYLRLLSTPGVPKKERCALLDKAFAEAHPYLVNFLKLLCEENLLAELPGCVRAYRDRYNADHGIIEATVVSAVPLNDTSREKLLAKLQELGINVDPDKILGLDSLAAGEYDLGELLYSTQDGYALQLTGTLVVKSGTQPEPKPEAPATDDKYTATLTSLQKKVVQAWEQSLVNDRDWHIEENRKIQLDNNSVKIEPVLFDEVNLQDEETPAE